MAEQLTDIESELTKLFKIKTKKGESKQKLWKRLALAGQGVSPKEWDMLSDEAQEWCNEAIKAIETGEEIEEPADGEAVETEGDEDGDTEGTGEDDGESEEDGEEEEKKPRRRRGKKDEPEDEMETEVEDDAESEDADPDETAVDDDTGDPEEEEEEEKKPKRGAKAKANPPAKKKPEPAKKVPAKVAAKGKDKDEPAEKKKPGRKAEGGGAQVLIKRLIVENPERTTEEILSLVHKQGYLSLTKSACSTTRSGMMQTLRLLKQMKKLTGVKMP